jgi:hypothetical protein
MQSEAGQQRQQQRRRLEQHVWLALCCLQPLLVAANSDSDGSQPQPHRIFSDDQLQNFADAVRRDGHVLMPGVLPPAKLTAIRRAFRPVLEARIARAGPDRGPGRYYATPPFVPPFFDPDIFQQPDVLGVVKRLVGGDAVMCQWAADTPHLGSEHQMVHRDAAPLYPELANASDSVEQGGFGFSAEPPATQLAVNIPLVAVLPPAEGKPSNGPFEVANGTHRLSVPAGQRLIESGQLVLRPVYMDLGDVMIRDVRGLHRGTPNLTPEPREMVVIGYSRAWLRRPEVGIRVKRSLFDSLDVEGQSLLRFENVVADAEFGEWPGEGWSPVYDSSALDMSSGASYKADL